MRYQQPFGRLSSFGFVAMVVALLGWPITGQADEDGLSLAGHWTLSGDSRDHSGNENHAENHGAQLGIVGPTARRQAARLDGRASYFSIPTDPSLRVGAGEFSLTAWVHVAKELDDVAGDIISKFDPATRTGFELSIRHNVGVTDSQANYRQLSFGIDQGRLGKWIDRGRPGNSLFAFSMTVFQDDLYIGTCEPGRDEAGHVYRFDGQAGWIDCGTPDRANSISSLIVHAGHLYAASCKYRLSGSSLAESKNAHPGGRVFRYEGDQQWVDCGRLGDAESIFGMVVFRGDLYASTLYSPGLYRYDGEKQWTHCGSPDGKRVEALAVFNGAIYCSGFDEGAVYRYDGKTWEHLGIVGDNTQTYGFAAYQGNLYVSSWRSGRVYRYEGDQKWIDVGRLGNELESMPLCIYNGKMYSGTLPLAEVYRYDGGQTWTSLGRIDTTPDVRYRRAWSMAVYRGLLFVGTLPSGRVQSIEAGKVVTYDRELAPGWRHVAAVKETDRLRLYVDGELVASSSRLNAMDFNLDNDRPLLIGFGQHDYFNGQLSDVRLVRRAVTKEEIAQIMASIQGRPSERAWRPQPSRSRLPSGTWQWRKARTHGESVPDSRSRPADGTYQDARFVHTCYEVRPW